MYEEHFGLSKKPFSIVPDPHYYYLSAGHAEAQAHLLYGIKSEGGFVLLTGDIGTGKTTACRRLLELLPEDAEVAFILNPDLTVEELLAVICREFGISYPEGNRSTQAFVARIHDYLLEVHARGRRAMLILEEAQNLKPEVLEQIRLLTNLETNEHKLLQMIMIGQPELRDLLSQPGLLQLSQRITARYHLGPLSREETSQYVHYRLSVAGCSRGHLFPPATLRRLFRLSRGIPRLINVICDRALLGAYVQEKDRVDPKTLKKAAGEVLSESVLPGQRSAIKLTTVALLLLFLTALGTAYFLYRYWPWVGTPSEPVALSPPAEAKARSVEMATLDWPGDLSGEKTRQLALGALLNLWRTEYEPGDVCKQAQAQGLRCMKGRGSLTNLRQLNKPAVLTLIDENKGPYYATLTALSQKTATVAVGQASRVVDLREINRCWSGDFLLLWRVPPEYNGELKPGSRGPTVAWLKRHLALAQGGTLPTGNGSVYDEECLKKVKKFQLTTGLVPDGIVGPKTIMPLSAVADTGDPLLHDGKEGF